ncbi:MAG TPA: zf-HC2 domain-containing protein, partial [Acidobacteriota bacterium]
MNACHEIRPWLEWLAADELEDGRRRLAQAHLRECPACRRELAAWRSLLASAAAPAAAIEAEVRSIDWDAQAGKIVAGVEGQGRRRRRPPAIVSLHFLAA